MFVISVLKSIYTIIVRLKISLYFCLTRAQYPTALMTRFSQPSATITTTRIWLASQPLMISQLSRLHFSPFYPPAFFDREVPKISVHYKTPNSSFKPKTVLRLWLMESNNQPSRNTLVCHWSVEIQNQNEQLVKLGDQPLTTRHGGIGSGWVMN